MVSSVLRLALILLAAAVLAIGARAIFVSRTQAPPPPVVEVPVLVAAADLPPGLLLREADLAWRPYPEDKVPRGALRQGTPQAELGGALVRKRLAEGTVLTAADIIRSDAPGFLAAVLQPGMRAVSVPIDDVSGNAGLIQPGDAVDLILTQRLDRGFENGGGRRNDSVVSETVVENARVIAVGTSFQASDANTNTRSGRARTVTLEVDPRAAEAVTVSAELGSLSLALRSFALDRNAEPGTESNSASVVAWSPDGEQARPVWGEDVSHALRATRQGDVVVPIVEPEPADANADPAPQAVSSPQAQPRRVLIIRGRDAQEQSFGQGVYP